MNLKDVKLVWATPDADKVLGYIARVSAPANQQNENVINLFRYMEKHGHVSPFTMANMAVEVNTTRAIGRQMIRHWTLAVQEFSQRYADVTALGDQPVILECRMQDVNNRQNSLENAPASVAEWFEWAQIENWDHATGLYREALDMGIAKEQARCFLPEGNTPSRLYFNGNFRSWIHYLRSRVDPTTQKEHRLIAEQISEIFFSVAPEVHEAFFPSIR